MAFFCEDILHLQAALSFILHQHQIGCAHIFFLKFETAEESQCVTAWNTKQVTATNSHACSVSIPWINGLQTTHTPNKVRHCRHLNTRHVTLRWATYSEACQRKVLRYLSTWGKRGHPDSLLPPACLEGVLPPLERLRKRGQDGGDGHWGNKKFQTVPQSRWSISDMSMAYIGCFDAGLVYSVSMATPTLRLSSLRGILCLFFSKQLLWVYKRSIVCLFVPQIPGYTQSNNWLHVGLGNVIGDLGFLWGYISDTYGDCYSHYLLICPSHQS